MKKQKTFTEVYAELKKLNEKSVNECIGKDKKLSATGKKYFVFPFLEQHGFDTWEKIYNEIVLISEKKCNLSKAVRESLITMYFQITQKANELNQQ